VSLEALRSLLLAAILLAACLLCIWVGGARSDELWWPESGDHDEWRVYVEDELQDVTPTLSGGVWRVEVDATGGFVYQVMAVRDGEEIPPSGAYRAPDGCRADIDQDGLVGLTDMSRFLQLFGGPVPGACYNSTDE